MASFSGLDDDDFNEIFLTQSCESKRLVSLEESDYKEPILDPKYLDISDAEDDQMETSLRSANAIFCFLLF